MVIKQVVWIGLLFIVKLIRIPNRDSAIASVQQSLISQYNFTENDEIIRRVNELFHIYFPTNIYTDPSESINKTEGGLV